MNPQRKKSAELFNLARRAPTPRQADAPPAPLGFAARVAAQWTGRAPALSLADLWERLCWWGAGTAVATCLLVVALRPAAPPANSLDLLLTVPSRPTTLF